MRKFLESSPFIDWNTSAISKRAIEISDGLQSDHDIIKACFEFVRDQIKHSLDYQLNPVTCKASDVLRFSTGYCFAKSHLLTALLRANGIPSGLCYQRLSNEGNHCLHGLSAVFLAEYGWYRIDPRGNKPDISTEFSPPQEKLAFSIAEQGEADLPEVWASPLATVVEALERSKTYLDVVKNLPDIELLTASK